MGAMPTLVLERDAPQKPGRRVSAWAIAAVVLMAAATAGALWSTRLPEEHVPAGFADVAGAGYPPPYFVDIEGNMIVVRSTLGGHLMSRYSPEPRWGASMHYLDDAVAGSANGRVFVAAFTDTDNRQTALFRFGLSASGKVIGLRQVPHSVMHGFDQLSLAVSANGNWAAIAGTPQGRRELAGKFPRGQASIVEVNTRTGQRMTWRGGLTRRGSELTIPSLSWGAGGSLYFLAQWCHGGAARDSNVECRSGSLPVSEVRRLRSAPLLAGSLATSRVVLRDSHKYPFLLQAVVCPALHAVIALVMNGSGQSIVRFDARTGRVVAEMYSMKSLRGYAAFLAADRTGRYLMLSENYGQGLGWLHAGHTHVLRRVLGEGETITF